MKIVNVRGMVANDPSIVYCGRASGGWKESILANRFIVGKDGTREEVIEKFRQWLWHAINHDDVIAQFLWEIPEDATLGCWCSPRACHCEVIAKAATWYHSPTASLSNKIQEA